MPASDDLPQYYDELHRWTVGEESFRAFSGLENDTIHRFLSDPQTGAFSPDTIYRFLDPLIPDREPLRGLDAGCGYGGTCFRYAQRHAGHWTGITISPLQRDRAAGIAQARGLDGRVAIEARSYDDPLPGRYDVIVAIESLIHSPDPAATLRNLGGALEPGGRLLIADDMPAPAPSAEDAALIEAFKAAWRCPQAPTPERWIALAAAAGLRLVVRQDLSHLLRPREEGQLDAALADLTAQRAGKIGRGFGRLSDAEIGGLHLERLHRRGAMRYVLLAFERL